MALPSGSSFVPPQRRGRGPNRAQRYSTPDSQHDDTIKAVPPHRRIIERRERKDKQAKAKVIADAVAAARTVIITPSDTVEPDAKTVVSPVPAMPTMDQKPVAPQVFPKAKGFSYTEIT